MKLKIETDETLKKKIDWNHFKSVLITLKQNKKNWKKMI